MSTIDHPFINRALKMARREGLTALNHLLNAVAGLYGAGRPAELSAVRRAISELLTAITALDVRLELPPPSGREAAMIYEAEQIVAEGGAA